MMAGAIDWILTAAAGLPRKRRRKPRSAQRRYQDAVLALTKAFALARPVDEAREIRDEVGFFQAVRAALVKRPPEQARPERP